MNTECHLPNATNRNKTVPYQVPEPQFMGATWHFMARLVQHASFLSRMRLHSYSLPLGLPDGGCASRWGSRAACSHRVRQLREVQVRGQHLLGACDQNLWPSCGDEHLPLLGMLLYASLTLGGSGHLVCEGRKALLNDDRLGLGCPTALS